MANNTTNEVVSPGSLERDGGGATTIGGDGIAHSARVVVASAHFIHRMSTSIVEDCPINKI